jgi:hypothetical protein
VFMELAAGIEPAREAIQRAPPATGASPCVPVVIVLSSRTNQ